MKLVDENYRQRIQEIVRLEIESITASVKWEKMPGFPGYSSNTADGNGVLFFLMREKPNWGIAGQMTVSGKIKLKYYGQKSKLDDAKKFVEDKLWGNKSNLKKYEVEELV